jgi:hypothetical protein
MVEMVGTVQAVLLCSRETELASSADTAREADPNKCPDFHVWAATGTQGNNTSNTFMAADMRELDLGDRGPVRASSGAVLRVKI